MSPRSWLARHPAVALVAGFTGLLLTICWLYGIFGGSLPFAGVAQWDGWARCVEAHGSWCPNIGYPIGVGPTLASSAIYGTFGLTRLGLSAEAALDVMGIAAIAIGLAGAWYLGRLLGRGHLAGALAGALYFLSPVVLQHEDLMQLYLGFAILPAMPALAVYLTTSEARVRGRVAAAVALLALGITLVYLDPYPWVVSTALAATVVAVSIGRDAVGRRAIAVLIGVGVLLLLAAPGLLFRSATASGAGLEAHMSEDFYRAMGIDVATAFVPTTSYELSHLTSLGAAPWRGQDFAGDGSQLSAAYLGIPLLLAAATAVVLLVLGRRKDGPSRVGTVAVGLALGGAVCFVLSLGPSLKIDDKDPTPRAGTLTVDDYLLPASATTAELPWASIYQHQPFASMRATYRWQAGARLVLAVGAAAGVTLLGRRRPTIAVVLGLVLVLDTLPHGTLDHRQVTHARQRELDRFEHDMDADFGHDRLHAGDRALFLPASNDYLIAYLAPRYGIDAYNLTFDKAIATIRPRQPAAIQTAIVDGAHAVLPPDRLCALFEADLVDVVPLDHFSLRWDSYRWPPDPTAVAKHRAEVDASGVVSDPRFVVQRGQYSDLVRPAPGGACAPDGKSTTPPT